MILSIATLLISVTAVIISAAAFYYAHLRRADVDLHIPQDQTCFAVRSTMRKKNVPLRFSAEGKPFVANTGGRQGIIENVSLKPKLPSEFSGSLVEIGIEREHRNILKMPSRLSVKDGDIIPLVFRFEVHLKGANENVDPKEVVQKLERLKSAEVEVTYITRWPEKHKKAKMFLDTSPLISEIQKE